MPEGSRSGLQHLGEKLLGLIEGKSQPEEVGATCVGVFFVPRRRSCREIEKNIPWREPGEQLLFRSFLRGDLNDVPLHAATSFQEDGDGLRGLKFARGIVVGKGNKKFFDLWELRSDAVPPIAVAIVENRAGLKNLLHPGGIFSHDADDHVGEFTKTKNLFDDRTDADVAGVIFSVTKGYLLR